MCNSLRCLHRTALSAAFIGDVSSARKLYVDALSRVRDNLNLWLSAIHFETLQAGEQRVATAGVRANMLGVL